jgi:DNA-binding HxlR family transcriptional regulator
MAGSRRSRCPVSCTLDILGDRWSLLVVRDLLRGKHRFGELTASAEGIPTNILAERLRRLKAKGIIRARRYSGAPPRVEYFLTSKGEDLRPVLRAMVDWGVRHAGGAVPPGYVATPSTVVPGPLVKPSVRRPRA